MSVDFSGRCKDIILLSRPRRHVTRLVMLSGSLRTGGDANEFDRAWRDSVVLAGS